MNDKSRVIQKRLITGLLSLAFMMSLVLTPASAAGFDGATFAAPILQNVERVEKTDLAEMESVLSEYSGESAQLLTSNVKEQLSVLQLEGELPQRAQLVRDNVLGRDVTRLTFDTYEADIDQDGQVVSVVNYADMHDNDDTILDGENTDPSAYPVTKGEALALADQIAKDYQLDGYQLVECSNDIPATWLLLWHKQLNNGVLNPYDMVTVTVDARDGSVMLMDRNKETLDEADVVVTETGAIRRSQPLRQELGGLAVSSTELTVFRPNFYWESTEVTYQEADFVRLAWRVTLEDGSAIYIDARTGETLGGDQTLSMRSRAVCAIPNVAGGQDCVNYASKGLAALGYTKHLNDVCYFIEEADIRYILNESNLKALYLRCHGDTQSKRITDFQKTGLQRWNLKYTEINGGYKLVYLDACCSSLKSYFSDAFLGKDKSEKCFVGWNVEIRTITSHSFGESFWLLVRSSNIPTVLDAVLQARSGTLRIYSDCNPGFRGDVGFDGYAA